MICIAVALIGMIGFGTCAEVGTGINQIINAMTAPMILFIVIACV